MRITKEQERILITAIHNGLIRIVCYRDTKGNVTDGKQSKKEINFTIREAGKIMGYKDIKEK